MKIHPVPKVGDTVVLNDWGLEQCFGHAVGLSHMKTLEMKIVMIDMNSMTAPEPTYVVEVDHADLNRLLIDHNCFDIKEKS